MAKLFKCNDGATRTQVNVRFNMSPFDLAIMVAMDFLLDDDPQVAMDDFVKNASKKDIMAKVRDTLRSDGSNNPYYQVSDNNVCVTEATEVLRQRFGFPGASK